MVWDWPLRSSQVNLHLTSLVTREIAKTLHLKFKISGKRFSGLGWIRFYLLSQLTVAPRGKVILYKRVVFLATMHMPRRGIPRKIEDRPLKISLLQNLQFQPSFKYWECTWYTAMLNHCPELHHTETVLMGHQTLAVSFLLVLLPYI